MPIYNPDGGGGGGGDIPTNVVTKTEADAAYYVSLTGSDLTGDGSAGAPFATIQKAIDSVPDLVQNNTVVYLTDAGTYTMRAFIQKLQNISSTTKYFTILGKQDVLVADFQATSFSATIADPVDATKVCGGIVLSGAGWTQSAYKNKKLVAISGKGYTANLIPLCIVDNTADTLIVQNLQVGTTYDATTHFKIYDPATTVNFTIGSCFTVASTQKSLIVRFQDLNITGGNQQITERDCAVWYTGCNFSRGAGAVYSILSYNAEANIYGCYFNGTGMNTGYYALNNTSVAAYDSVFDTYSGVSNRQVFYMYNTGGSATNCRFVGNYCCVRSFGGAGQFSYANNCFITGSSYANYSQRGGNIDAYYATGYNNAYGARCADGGIVIQNETLIGYTTDAFYLDSAGGGVIEVVSNFLRSKEIMAQEDKTVNYTVPAYKSGTILKNTGAAGEVIFSLPTAVLGLTFRATVVAAQYLRIKAASGDRIENVGTFTNTAGYVRSNAPGSIIELVCMDATTWRALRINGEWVTDTNIKWPLQNNAYVGVTGNTTLNYTNRNVNVTAAATITFPTAVGWAGHEFSIFNSHNNAISTATTSGQTVHGGAAPSIATGCTLTVISNGANWLIKSLYTP